MNQGCSKTVRNADATGSWSTKQEAKQEAAKNIQKKIKIKKDKEPNTIVSDLHELLKQRKMTPPKYVYSMESFSSPNGHVWNASCILESGCSELGVGKSCQIARRQAAAKMLKRLNDSIVDISMPIPAYETIHDEKTYSKKKAEINPFQAVKQENESPKEIIERKVIGTVKWFNVKEGYGVINRNDTKEDVFIHHTAIDKNNPLKVTKSVGEGETLEFNVAIGENGYESINVTRVNGRQVQGSNFALYKKKAKITPSQIVKQKQVQGSNFALDIKVSNKNKGITKTTKEKRNTINCNSKNPSSAKVERSTVVKKEKSDLSYVLECPICYELPQNPVYQCANGHLICNICHSKVEKCPICVVNLDSAKPLRNLTAEYLINDLLRMTI